KLRQSEEDENSGENITIPEESSKEQTSKAISEKSKISEKNFSVTSEESLESPKEQISKAISKKSGIPEKIPQRFQKNLWSL
ncbi:13400_t:CDS:1, partial [Funneliformis geosporum]